MVFLDIFVWAFDSDKENNIALFRPVADGFLVRYVRCPDRWQMVSWSGLYGQLDSDKRDNLELSGPVVDGFLVRYVRAFDSGWNG